MDWHKGTIADFEREVLKGAAYGFLVKINAQAARNLQGSGAMEWETLVGEMPKGENVVRRELPPMRRLIHVAYKFAQENKEDGGNRPTAAVWDMHDLGETGYLLGVYHGLIIKGPAALKANLDGQMTSTFLLTDAPIEIWEVPENNMKAYGLTFANGISCGYPLIKRGSWADKNWEKKAAARAQEAIVKAQAAVEVELAEPVMQAEPAKPAPVFAEKKPEPRRGNPCF